MRNDLGRDALHAEVGEIHGIAHEIMQNLLQPIFISEYRRQLGRNRVNELHVFMLSEGAGQCQHDISRFTRPDGTRQNFDVLMLQL